MQLFLGPGKSKALHGLLEGVPGGGVLARGSTVLWELCNPAALPCKRGAPSCRRDESMAASRKAEPASSQHAWRCDPAASADRHTWCFRLTGNVA